MNDNYQKCRDELALTLINAGAKHLEFDKEKWKATFQMHDTEFYAFFDDGIDCMYKSGYPFFSPLTWSDEALNELRLRLLNFTHPNEYCPKCHNHYSDEDFKKQHCGLCGFNSVKNNARFY